MTRGIISQVKEAIRDRGISDVVLALFPDAVRSASGIHMGSVKGEKGQSLSVERTKGYWKDHATGDKGADLIALWKQHRQLSSKTEAAIELAERLSIEIAESKADVPRKPTPVPADAPLHNLKLGMPFPGNEEYRLTQIFEYRDETDALLSFVLRYEKLAALSDQKQLKKVVPYSFDHDANCWKMRAPKTAYSSLYGLQKLRRSPDRPVLLVEGEKTADAAAEQFPDHVAVTWPGGTGAIGKVDAAPLRGRDVVIWPDNDEPGRKVVPVWQMKLAEIGAASFKVVDPSDVKIEKWDLADAIPDGIDVCQMLARAEPIDLRELRTFNRLDMSELVKRLIYVGKLAILVDEC
ncbi:putative regulatory protein RepA [Roseibium sp. TrichSKD4]|uniref:DUF6371 domain-containing protein n=1 Tax=Roseibium sp. TrichSKD4 TaxID=744980 RepID=UPI0001E569D6|nr:DUF6371 domain-containing protein [Roseibium sp. TrichSKD4]EFO32521.1 putative regulatory protein RepA [Roseibium sp. TrichSKD4]